jgi:hypothetical protein
VQVENAQHPLAVDRLKLLGTALAVQQRRDAPVAVGRPRVDEAAQGGKQLVVFGLALAAAGLRRARCPGVELGPADPDRLGHGLHREPSFGGDGGSHVRFLLPT